MIWKRIFDVLLALFGLAILSPLIAAACVVVWVTLGRPVLYRQMRGGLGNRPFVFTKLRTMTNAVGPDGNLLPDAQRITPVGRFLRRTSIDELPQLWNVLMGDMSLVGPRPLRLEYLARYSQRQRRRHDVRPGITGWAQVKGPNGLTWEEKFEHDVWYIDHWSPMLDLKIIGLTDINVIRGQGISEPGHSTMSEFLGSSPKHRKHPRPTDGAA